MKNNLDLSLYLVTDRDLSLGRSILEIVELAVKGGVSIVQLREKNISSLEFYNLAFELKKLLSNKNVPLIINDRLDIALAVKADGLHIGQSDLPYKVVRDILGVDAIIGLSVESVEDAIIANDYDVDYLGISPVYSTTTKTDTAAAIGIEGIKKIKDISKHKLVGIGGLNESTIPNVIKAGVDGVAVVSAICSAANPFESSKNLKEIISQAKMNR